MEEKILNPVKSPNQEYLEMNFVGETATGRGTNQRFCMENLHDGTFLAVWSRVGITIGRHAPRKKTYPMEQWEQIYKEYTQKRGFLVTKQKKQEKIEVEHSDFRLNGHNYRMIDDPDVNEIVSRILLYARQTVAQNYTVKVDDISDEMLLLGQKLLSSLAEAYPRLSVAAFNNKLKVLFSAIPRRMDDVSKHLAKRTADFAALLEEEQSLYDLMYSQVRSEQKLSSFQKMPTVLEAYDLSWRECSPEEYASIREKLGGNKHQLLRAWSVDNHKTRQDFQQFIMERGFGPDEIQELFHGSRNENFWSITTTGLKLCPINVVTTGHMYGNGIYFANKAQKSLGYTSRRGSRWANGTEASGLLAIYEVAVGNTFDVADYQPGYSSLNYEKLQTFQPGADTLWAHGGNVLYNDELVIFREQQCTIKYLLEMTSE